MNFRNAYWWSAIAAIVLILYLLFFALTDGDMKFVSYGYALLVFSILLIVLIAGAAIVSLLFALFSIRKGKFRKSVVFLLPILFLTFVIITAVAGFLYSKGNTVSNPQQKILVNFNNVESPTNQQYKDVRTGFFVIDELHIDRFESAQNQKNALTGEQDAYVLKWHSPSFYEITNVKDSSHKLFVKITEVTPSGYYCYYCSDIKKGRPVYYAKISYRD